LFQEYEEGNGTDNSVAA